MKCTSSITTSDYAELINPALANRLQLLRLDKNYHKGKGAYLYYLDHNKTEVKVIDFVSGYGAVLLGHSNSALKATAISYLKANQPGFVQMSVKDTATRVAQWLHNEMEIITGKAFVTIFANSGAEAIEAAIKHALIEFHEKMNAFNRKFEQEAAYILHAVSEKNERLAPVAEEAINRYRQHNRNTVAAHPPLVLAAKHGFHGKTLRAAMTSWNPEYSKPFCPYNSATVFTDGSVEELHNIVQNTTFDLAFPCYSDERALQHTTISFNQIAAALVEPIQGEGGIRILPHSFLSQLAEICRNSDIPLIFDEIQTGCYRTGYLLASTPTGITADYYVLGKALGGGLAKISAVMIAKKRYLEQFGLMHSSTYAEDGWSSQVSLKALELSKEKSRVIQSKGNAIIQRLKRLKEAYPEIVCDVRGRGLMLGLEFKDFSESNSYCFQMLGRGGYLHYVYASYLLNVWNIRLSAPLSAKNVLRIQPSVCISRTDIDRLMQGLYALCEILYCEDLYKLIEFSLPKAAQGFRESPWRFDHGKIPREKPLEGATKVGFLTHFIHAETVRASEPSLCMLDDQQLEDLVEKILPLGTPAIAGSKNITDNHGKTVHITFAGLSLTSALCRRALSSKIMTPQIDLCRKAVQTLKEAEHVGMIGLGQYTSILTSNGRLIGEPGVGLTTGNSLTAYLAIEAIHASLRQKSINIHDTRVGIIGAAGNIATLLSEWYSGIAGGVVLLGNSSQNSYMKTIRTARNLYQKVAAELINNQTCQVNGLAKWLINAGIIQKIRDGAYRLEDPNLYEHLEREFGNRLYLRVARSISDISGCQLVIAATNAAKPFLYPEHLPPHSIVCDLSVPHNCSPELINNEKSIEVIFGGIACLPNREQIPVKGFPLKDGHIFGCMGETLLLGLEGYKKPFSLGNITLQQVEWIGAIAQKHGFAPWAVHGEPVSAL